MKKAFTIVLLFIGIVMSGILLQSCGNTTQKEEKVEKEPKIVSMEFQVHGMTCTGCENTVNTSVSAIEGVLEVKASHIDSITYVVFDESSVKVDDISEIIESKGYAVVGHNEAQTLE